MRKYFVSYAHEEGFGSCEMNVKGDLTIRSIIEEIERTENVKKNSVIILFFKEFKKGERYS